MKKWFLCRLFLDRYTTIFSSSDEESDIDGG